MIIISLGYTCYIKSLINITKFKKNSDLFDWMNSFEFAKIVDSIYNEFDIFKNISKSNLEVDYESKNVLFNDKYMFRLPHEEYDQDKNTIKYNRRYKRFIEYKQDVNNDYLFIRMINTGRYGLEKEDLKKNYSHNVYNRIIEFLPIRSKILLITDTILSVEEKSLISS